MRKVFGIGVVLSLVLVVVGVSLSSAPATAAPTPASGPLCSTGNPQMMVLEFEPDTAVMNIHLPAQNFIGDVDWGDGTFETYNGERPQHTYSGLTTGSPFYVCLLGAATEFGAPNSPQTPSDPWNPWSFHWDGESRLTRVSQWGSLGTRSLGAAFNGADHLYCVANDMTDPVIYMDYMFKDASALGTNCSYSLDFNDWNTSNVVSMYQAFSGATWFNGDIRQWDTSSVDSMAHMFVDAAHFNQDISGWDTSTVTGMEQMFVGASAFNADIGGWDTSNVEVMDGMFQDATSFNQDISGWDTISVYWMFSMFQGASSFNQDLSAWDTSGVTDMSEMFEGATAFNGDLSLWDTSSVEDMSSMFAWASAFNQDISGWDTSSVRSMAGMFTEAASFDRDISPWETNSLEDTSFMFAGATSFNTPLNFSPGPDPNDPTTASAWNTAQVTWMESMFEGATSFNQDLSDWETGSVEDMSWMFNGALAFNGDVSGWNTSSVTSMDHMFSGAVSFNQHIGSWDTHRVESMYGMFYGALAFNQDLSNWNIMYLNDATYMLVSSMMSNVNYSKLLRSWANQPHQSGGPYLIALDATAQYYSTVESDRQALTDDLWIISDGGPISAQTPTITTAPTASAITAGQQLGSSTLSGGSASQPGTFTFTNPTSIPASGTVLASVTFVPDNDIQFNAVTLSVSVEVNAAPEQSSLVNTGAKFGALLPASALLLAFGILALHSARARRALKSRTV